MLIGEGYNVTVAARREPRLRRVAEEIGAHAVTADATREDECAVLVDAHGERFGRLDVLVNAAGAARAKPIQSTRTAVLDSLYAANVRSAFTVIRLALPMLREARGLIVNVTSLTAVEPVAGAAAYAATKGALHSLTAALNVEEESAGVRATALAPALVDTPMASWPLGRRDELLRPEDCAEVVRCLIRLGPTARIPEIVIERVRA
jgi:NADP-dependent 3-hydroxy acid dehydrogenase YdfG